jgi:CDP-glycerol glycerophosphotransferase (TagB/SpsB family)
VHKRKKEQIRIHLGHGMPLKKALKYCRQIGDFDYILSLSKTFNKQMQDNYETSSDKIINFGYCRNDNLIKCKNRDSLFKEKYQDKKIIVWLPTYRNHKNGDEDISVKSDLMYGLPCIGSNDDIVSLNDVLHSYNMILMIKLHPAQRSEEISNLNLSNISIITDQDLFIMNTTLYQLLAKSCALITDYSSVYYDYLITRKPIGLAISDITEYERKIGFAFDNYYDEIKGHYVYNIKDLMEFVKEINKESGMSEKIVNRFHDFPDDNSSERVYQFLKKFL